MKKVSVIIPIYQVERSITRCVQSVLEQTYENIEILCVDDCGTDRSIQLVEQMRKQYPDRIHLIYGEENVGLGGARDRGLRAAEGDFVAFLDSDDYWEKDFIAHYMEAMGEQVDVVAGSFTRVMPKKRYHIPVDVNDETFIWENISACTKLYRKSFLEKHQIDFAGIRHYEDILFSCKLLLQRPVVRLIDYAGYYYCLNQDSITQSRREERSSLAEEYFENIAAFLDGLEQAQKRNTMFGYCMISNLTAVLLFNGRGCGMKKMKELYSSFQQLCKRIVTECYGGAKVKTGAFKAESRKKKYAAWLIWHLRGIRCDRIVFLLVSLL